MKDLASGLLKISNLSVFYGLNSNPVKALENVSFEIPATGYTIGLVGESGSGKTTLGLSVLNVIEPPGKISGGEITYEGTDVLKMSKSDSRKYRWEKISMVYQSAMNSLNPVRTISDHIVEILVEHSNLSKSEARERAKKLLSEVGIREDRAFDYPHEFSGGMRQRVVIAMALALSPKLLIADEPTSALDVVTQKQILALLKREIKQRGLSLLFITHEISILCGLVENVAVMHRGEIVERGSTDEVLFDPLHPYTERLLNTLVTLDLESLPAVEMLGRESDNHSGPISVGCKYANRCKYAFARCSKESPQLLEATPGRFVACHKYN